MDIKQPGEEEHRHCRGYAPQTCSDRVPTLRRKGRTVCLRSRVALLVADSTHNACALKLCNLCKMPKPRLSPYRTVYSLTFWKPKATGVQLGGATQPSLLTESPHQFLLCMEERVARLMETCKYSSQVWNRQTPHPQHLQQL